MAENDLLQQLQATGRARVPEARFWEKVGVGPGCWEWLASVNHSGYGYFNVATKPSRCVLAHRYAYELLIGAIPEGLCVLHRCDNPKCVRPNHLFLGTRTDNSADKVAKGRARGPRGTRHPRCRLTEDEVTSIRASFARGGVTKSDLARTFGIGHTAVRSIISGKTWKHLSGVAS